MTYLAKKECQAMLEKGLCLGEDTFLALDVAFNRPVRVYCNCRIVQSSIDSYTVLQPNVFCTNAQIGRYCTIGQQVKIGRPKLPMNSFSTSPAFHGRAFSFVGVTNPVNTMYVDPSIWGAVEPVDQPYTEIKIGHDVWVGEESILTWDAEIGHGAIIRQKAQIRGNIPPYAIVEGDNKIVGYRFSDEEIADLLEVQWWNYDVPQMLKAGIKISMDKPRELIDFFKNADPNQLIPLKTDWQKFSYPANNEPSSKVSD